MNSGEKNLLTVGNITKIQGFTPGKYLLQGFESGLRREDDLALNAELT
jgi:hypothetical protein